MDTYELIQKWADEKGLTMDQALERIDRNIALGETLLHTRNRLAAVEELIKTHEIPLGMVQKILSRNPILEPEIKELAVEIRTSLGKYFDIPEYSIQHNERFNAQGFTTGVGMAHWRTQTLELPTLGSYMIPVIIAHEHGHAYQHMHSKLWWILRPLVEDPERYNARWHEASHLIEGFGNFAALLHARQRDAKLGTSFYEPILRESAGLEALLSAAQGTNGAIYYDGMRLYEQIFAREGIEGVKHAALNFTTDAELRAYAGRNP